MLRCKPCYCPTCGKWYPPTIILFYISLWHITNTLKIMLVKSSILWLFPVVLKWSPVLRVESGWWANIQVPKKKLENHLTPFLFSIKWKLFLWHCKKIHFCWIRNNIHYFKQHVPFERTYGLVKLFLTWKILLVNLGMGNGDCAVCTLQCTLGSYCLLPKNWYWFSQ